jgi:pSer/pThr/pTyr-binding forkhead associated (FHA) protein
MAYLIQSGKDNQVKIFRLEGSCVTIGRNPAHDVALTDPFLSRDHAEIVCLDDSTFEIRDLGAKSPVKINGEIISKHKLKAGDKILLGHTEFVFRTDEASCVELLPAEEMEQESVEVTSVDAKKTFTFSKEELDSKDLASLHKDHQRLMLLYELGKTVNSHLEDPHYLLDEIMNTAFKMLNAERGFIALVDESTGKLTCELVRDVTADKEPEKLEVSRTIVHKVVSDRVSIMTVNAQKDSEFKKIKSVQDYNIRSAMCGFRQFLSG